jgi:AbrB family looped-hinge helix DNA binding protein
MGNMVGMGEDCLMIEIDDRGRLTLPVQVREQLAIKSGDKLSISITSDMAIVLRKAPTREQVFTELVGCISTKTDETPTPEAIKGIWKTSP